jgi:hypothetical protein
MTHCFVNHHVTGHLVFVLVSAERVMMCPSIDNPTTCEICYAIRFLHAKDMSAAEIHRELCAVCGQNVMSEGTILEDSGVECSKLGEQMFTMKSEVVDRL